MRPQDLDRYTAVAVSPRGEIRIATLQLAYTTAAGTRYHTTESRWLFRSWAEALHRRKPWQQGGPILIYPVEV